MPVSEVNLHRHRGMGRGSFWLPIVVGRYRLDTYWEPINGWRHFRIRLGVFWFGPLLIIGQNWKKRQDSDA